MEYQYNEEMWGPAWIWVFGFFLFLGGIALTIWFFQMARDADEDDTPPRAFPRELPPDGAGRRG